MLDKNTNYGEVIEQETKQTEPEKTAPIEGELLSEEDDDVGFGDEYGSFGKDEFGE